MLFVYMLSPRAEMYTRAKAARCVSMHSFIKCAARCTPCTLRLLQQYRLPSCNQNAAHRKSQIRQTHGGSRWQCAGRQLQLPIKGRVQEVTEGQRQSRPGHQRTQSAHGSLLQQQLGVLKVVLLRKACLRHEEVHAEVDVWQCLHAVRHMRHGHHERGIEGGC